MFWFQPNSFWQLVALYVSFQKNEIYGDSYPWNRSEQKRPNEYENKPTTTTNWNAFRLNTFGFLNCENLVYQLTVYTFTCTQLGKKSFRIILEKRTGKSASWIGVKEKSLSYALCLCFEWDYVREFPPTYWINKRQTITTKPKMSSFCHFFLLLLLTWLGWIAKRSVIDFVGTDFHEIALQAHQPTILTYFLISFNSPVRVAQLSISELFADLFHFSVTAPLLIRSLLAYDDFSWRIPRTAQKFELFTAKKKIVSHWRSIYCI